MTRTDPGRLRITHVVGTDQFAGLERYVVDVSNELGRRGHDVEVVGGRQDAMTALLEPTVRWRTGSSAPVALRTLAGSGRRDVVHSHITKADFVASAAGPVNRGRLVSTRHIVAPRGYSPVARRLAPLVRRRLHTEIAVSRWTSDQLERPSDAVLLNGVSVVPDVDDPARERTVLIAQRLELEKDTATALRAWQLSGLGDDGWQLVVAGRGDQRAPLEAQAAASGIAGSVRFAGFVDDPTVLYRRVAMLVATAPTEPCGLTVLEAMAHGVPVLAAGSGGHLETVGTAPRPALFAPGDADAAAGLLREYAADAALRVAYGAGLRALQRRDFSIAAHVDGLESVYLAGGRR